MNTKTTNSKTKTSLHTQFRMQSNDVVGSYEKHPFFVKKVASAKVIINSTGLPKQLNKKII